MSSNYVNVLYRRYVCVKYIQSDATLILRKRKFCAANPTMLDVKFTSSSMKE